MLKGALYKQVRNMVGSALDVCRGVLSEEEFRSLICGGDANPWGRSGENAFAITRDTNPSKPAPPEGLTLEYVYFDNEDEDF